MYANPVRGGENSECVFKDETRHLTDRDFQTVYGNRFQYFATKPEADDFARTQPHAWVSRITNYFPGDVFDGGKVKPDAQKFTVGYLVSLVALRRK